MFVKNLSDIITAKLKEQSDEYVEVMRDNPNSPRLKKLLKPNFSIPYFPRLNLFKRANLTFDPVTGLGHSYQWYEICKVINGKMVLNTYRYSVTTSKHVSLLRYLFDQLGIDYVSIEAPRGLQNLDIARSHMIDEIATLKVQLQYARKPNAWAGTITSNFNRSMDTIGMPRITKNEMNDAVKQAESDRRKKLDRIKARKQARNEKDKAA